MTVDVSPASKSAAPPLVGRVATRGRPGIVARAVASEHAILVLTIAYTAAAWPLFGRANLSNVFADVLPLLAVALGQMLVLIVGGIDLSVTSVIALASVTGSIVMNEQTGLLAGHRSAVPVSVVAMLGIGCAVGLFNGAAISAGRLPPFIVTLATMMIGSGAAVWATRSRNIPLLPDAFVELGQGAAVGIPIPLLIVGALAISMHVVLSRTLWGRWLYATGQNARAARISGVPVAAVTVAAYLVCGFCASVASVLYTARLETGSPTLGRTILLDVIGATVIGGTSLFGGRGKVLWTAVGVLLFTLISNTLDQLGLGDDKTMVVKGCVILGAAALDWTRHRTADSG